MSSSATTEATNSTQQGDPGDTPGPFNNSALDDQNVKYYVGGGVVACLVLAIVVAIVLWRRRPRSEPNAETEFDSFKNKRRNSYCEVAETPDQDKITRNKKQKRSAPPEDPYPNGNDVMVPVDSAPDIITAHDGDSIYETIDGRRFTRSKASLTAPDRCACPPSANSTLNRTYDHLDHYRVERNKDELCGNSDFNPLMHSATGTVNSTGGSMYKGVKTGQREQWTAEAETQDDNCSPRSSSNSYTASLEGQIKETRRDQRVSGLAVDKKNESPHIKRSSLAESVSNLGSGNGRRIVCQLTMVGVVENGKPIPLQHTPASNAYFVLEPKNDSDSEDPAGFSLAPNARYRIRDEELCRVQTETVTDPYFTLEPLDEQEDIINTLVRADTQGKGHSSRINPHAQAATGAVNSTDGCMHRGVKGQSSKVNAHDAQARSRGSQDIVQSQDLGFRSSLHGHNIVSTFCELVKGHKQKLPFRDGRIRSCPDEYSQESAPPSSHPSSSSPLPPGSPGPRDFRRSLSSPNPRPLPIPEPTKSSSSSVRDRKLDPAFLQSRIQQEMMALGLSFPPPSQHDQVSKKQTPVISNYRTNSKKFAHTDSDACAKNKNVSCSMVSERTNASRDSSSRGDRNASVRGPPATNEYFILEPDAANYDRDDTTGVIHSAPSFKFASTPRADERREDTRTSPQHLDVQGKHRYQRQQSHGPPPRLPRRNQGVASHTRSRSDAPLLVKPQQPYREDEEQGPVIVSFKKSKSMPAGAPTRTDDKEEEKVTREGSFRARINSVPS